MKRPLGISTWAWESPLTDEATQAYLMACVAWALPWTAATGATEERSLAAAGLEPGRVDCQGLAFLPGV